MEFFATIRNGVMENKYTKEIWGKTLFISFCFLFFILAQFFLDKTPKSINLPFFLCFYLIVHLFFIAITTLMISEVVGDFMKIESAEDFQEKRIFLRMRLNPLLENKNIHEIIVKNLNQNTEVLNKNWLVNALVVLGIAPTMIFSIIYGVSFFI